MLRYIPLEILSFTFYKLFLAYARGHLIRDLGLHQDGSTWKWDENTKCSQRRALPDTVKLNQILVILCINDTLIKKYLFNHNKFIAGKSQQGQVETDLQSCWTATKYGLRSKTINSFEKKEGCAGFTRAQKLISAVYVCVHTLPVCRGGCHNMWKHCRISNLQWAKTGRASRLASFKSFSMCVWHNP